jgi:hypothetical protein
MQRSQRLSFGSNRLNFSAIRHGAILVAGRATTPKGMGALPNEFGGMRQAGVTVNAVTASIRNIMLASTQTNLSTIVKSPRG